MPVSICDNAALPECFGTQWSVIDEDELAELTAQILLGRARHVAEILRGSQKQKVNVSKALKVQLHKQLHPKPGPTTYHRDGLLFEIMTWIVASMASSDMEVVSDPHLSSTQQGIDTIKITLNHADKKLLSATIYEQKCTENSRQEFQSKVLPAFKKWHDGDYDNKLAQLTLGLLDRFHLNEAQQLALYDDLLQQRPLVFRAAITVTPQEFDQAKCIALFKDYAGLPIPQKDRFGDTLPLSDVRDWFAQFSARVWQRIDSDNV